MIRLNIYAALLAFTVCMLGEGVELSGIVELTLDNFGDFINGEKPAIVDFYTPWCGHCKRLAPEMKRLSDVIQQDLRLSKQVIIGKVNVDEYPEFIQEFKITKFPTIIWFPKGKPTSQSLKYQKSHTAEAMYKFIVENIEEDVSFARLEQMDAFAKMFMISYDKKAILKEAQQAINGLEGEDKQIGQMYYEFMQSSLKKGGRFFNDENRRLRQLLNGGALNKQQFDEVLIKISVLSAFLVEDDIRG